MSPQEIAGKAWDYAVKHDAPLMDVLWAAAGLIQVVAYKTGYSSRLLANTVLQELAKKESAISKG